LTELILKTCDNLDFAQLVIKAVVKALKTGFLGEKKRVI